MARFNNADVVMICVNEKKVPHPGMLRPFKTANGLLKKRKDKREKADRLLLDKEVIEGEEIRALIV